MAYKFVFGYAFAIALKQDNLVMKFPNALSNHLERDLRVYTYKLRVSEELGYSCYSFHLFT